MVIFLVDSPLQYLNAQEAKHQFQLDNSNSVLIVFEGVSKKNFRQIKSLVDIDDWNKVHFLRYNQHRVFRYLLVPYLNLLRRKYEPIEKVFIGEYRSDLMRHFSNASLTKEIYLLDDGNVSTIIHKSIEDRIGVRKKTKKLRSFLNRMVGLKDNDIFDINYFTIYSNERKESGRNIVTNNYEYIKSKVVNYTVKDKIYFIGNNLPELDIISYDTYLDKFKDIREIYKNKKIVYIPHRRESEEKLNSLSQIDGIEIRDYGEPIEFALIKDKTIPIELASFFSSALDNCYHIFGDRLKITSFKLDKNILSNEVHEKFEEIFKIYESYGENFSIKEI